MTATDSTIAHSRAKARKIMVDIHGKTPPGHVVHHVDGNPHNNKVSNLQIMSVGEHVRHHLKGKKRTNTRMLQITLSDQTYKSLESLCNQEKIRPSTMVVAIVRKALEKDMKGMDQAGHDGKALQ